MATSTDNILSIHAIRAAINRAMTKLARQKQAVGATEAELSLWQAQLDAAEKAAPKAR